MYLKEFWVISKPEVATPPAFAAFPGANNIFAFRKTSIASLVEGIFAPSLTHLHPLLTSIFASLPFNSFCVAHGKQKNGYVNYVKGANIAGFVKVADAMLAQGVI